MPEPICKHCKFFGMHKGGCYYGPYPTQDSRCIFKPSKFWTKDMPESRGPEGFTVETRLTGYKPKGERVSFTTKKGKQVSFRKGSGKK
jgi:hypothetical protein